MDDMIPRAEADARVAAAYANAIEWCNGPMGESPVPEDAQAALDRRIAEAVKAERERVVAKFDDFADELICAITAQFIRDLGKSIRAGE